MGTSSINIQPVKNTSESHNLRLRDYAHVKKDLTPDNFNWGFETKLSELLQDQKKLYQEKVGQKMQEKARPIREGVFLFEEKHTNEDLLRVVKNVEKKFGIKAVQLSVHRDEGHYEKHTKVWKPNLHAHVVFDWQNKKTGKTFKLSRADMSKLQTHFSEGLGMDRGKKSLKTHLNALEYKILQKEKEIEINENILDFIKEETDFTRNEIDNLEQVIEQNHKALLVPSDKTKLAAYEKLKKTNPKIKEMGEKMEAEIRRGKNKGKRL